MEGEEENRVEPDDAIRDVKEDESDDEDDDEPEELVISVRFVIADVI